MSEALNVEAEACLRQGVTMAMMLLNLPWTRSSQVSARLLTREIL